jgi:hypothetical protein
MAVALPKFDKIQTNDPAINIILDSLEKTLNPVFDNPLLSGQQLKNIALVTGINVVNHKLGRKLQGWFITRPRAVAATFFDTQDTNKLPALTLEINSSVDIIVDIYVY